MIPVSVVFTKTVTNYYPAIIVLQKAPTGTENLKPKSVVVPLRSAIQMFLSQNLWDGCLSPVNWRMERLLFVMQTICRFKRFFLKMGPVLHLKLSMLNRGSLLQVRP